MAEKNQQNSKLKPPAVGEGSAPTEEAETWEYGEEGDEEPGQFEEFPDICADAKKRNQAGKKRKKMLRLGMLFHNVQPPKSNPPWYWDTGKLAKHRMNHLPEEKERTEQNIQWLQTKLWDTITPGPNMRGPPLKTPQTSKTKVKTRGRGANKPKVEKVEVPVEAEGKKDPTKIEALERIPSAPKATVLPTSLEEGHQLQQGSDKEEAKLYVEANAIRELFQAMMMEILTYRPSSPVDHLIQMLHEANFRKMAIQCVAAETGIESSAAYSGNLRKFLNAFDQARAAQGLQSQNRRGECDPAIHQPKTTFVSNMLSEEQRKLAYERLYSKWYKSVPDYIDDVLLLSQIRLMRHHELHKNDRNWHINNISNNKRNPGIEGILQRNATTDANVNNNMYSEKPPVVVMYYSRKNKNHYAVVESLRKHAERYVFFDPLFINVDPQGSTERDLATRLPRCVKENENFTLPEVHVYRKGHLIDTVSVRDVATAEQSLNKTIQQHAAKYNKLRGPPVVHRVTTRQHLLDVMNNTNSKLQLILFYSTRETTGELLDEMVSDICLKNSFVEVSVVDVPCIQGQTADVEMNLVVDEKRRSCPCSTPNVQMFRDGVLKEDKVVDGAELMRDLLHSFLAKEQNIIQRRRSAISMGQMSANPADFYI